MIHTIILPLFGLFRIYYTFCTLISLTSNKVLLIFLTLPAVFIQITFTDLILTQFTLIQNILLHNNCFHYGKNSSLTDIQNNTKISSVFISIIPTT